MGRPNTRPQPFPLAPLDKSLPGVRLINALAVDADDEAVFADRRFEMAVEVASGFTPNLLRIFSLTSSVAAEVSSSQRSIEQRGRGFVAEVADAESAISVDQCLIKAGAFSVFLNPPRFWFKSLLFAGFPVDEFNMSNHLIKF